MSPDLLVSSLKSKTVWFGLALSFLSVFQSYLADSGLTPEQLGVMGPLVGTLIIVLRAVTNKPLSEK
jgi:hypothetical protein